MDRSKLRLWTIILDLPKLQLLTVTLDHFFFTHPNGGHNSANLDQQPSGLFKITVVGCNLNHQKVQLCNLSLDRPKLRLWTVILDRPK